jgi:HNH endonuclease
VDIEKYKINFLNEINKAKKIEGLKNSLKASISYLEMNIKSLNRAGDLYIFLSHYKKNNKSKIKINEIMKNNNLQLLDDLLEQGEVLTEKNKDDISQLNDFKIGETYSPWLIALFSKTFTIQNGIYPIYGDNQAILIVADLNKGVHPNKWLKEDFELKYYFKKTPQGTYNHKYNREIIESKEKGIPLYVFIKEDLFKDGKNLFLNGLFEFISVNIEGEKKWFKLVRKEFSQSVYLQEAYKGVDIGETEVTTMIKARIGQSKFKRIILQMKKSCEICGLAEEKLLIASHIKPWNKSNNKEPLDCNNGLLLCPNHDSVFDKGYISFDEEGKIIISERLNECSRTRLNIQNTIKLNLNKFQKDYMAWHRNHFEEILY